MTMEIEIESKQNFLENLQYQITKNSRLYNKIPAYCEQINDLNYRFNFKELILDLKKKFKKMQYRRDFSSDINEFEEKEE